MNRSLCLISLSTLHEPFYDHRTVDSPDVYVTGIRPLLHKLISGPQSLTSLINRLRVPPFTSILHDTVPTFYPQLCHHSLTGASLYDYYGFI